MNPIHSHVTRARAITASRLAAACVLTASLSGCLNPTFVNSLSGGTARSAVPLAPGDTPYVHILVINASALYELDFQVAFTPAFQGYNSVTLAVPPETQEGIVLPCPVSQVGLGDPLDLTYPAIVLNPIDGSNAINIPAGAFPLTLKSGENFNCGDTVVFTVVDDRTSGFGIAVSTGRVDGTTQTGPFSGPDTYEVLQLLLLSSGTPPTTVP